jgi:predicted dehydrogenase
VYAEVNVRADVDGFDDQFFASLRHRSGVTSHLWGTWVLHGAPGRRFRVVGTTGTYAVDLTTGRRTNCSPGDRRRRRATRGR